MKKEYENYLKITQYRGKKNKDNIEIKKTIIIFLPFKVNKNYFFEQKMCYF